jgi:hypothetical protein
MRHSVAVMIAASLLSGCALDLKYTKIGGSDEEMARTLADCKVKAAMVPGNDAWAALGAGNVRDNCMRAQGWIRSQ